MHSTRRHKEVQILREKAEESLVVGFRSRRVQLGIARVALCRAGLHLNIRLQQEGCAAEEVVFKQTQLEVLHAGDGSAVGIACLLLRASCTLNCACAEEGRQVLQRHGAHQSLQRYGQHRSHRRDEDGRKRCCLEYQSKQRSGIRASLRGRGGARSHGRQRRSQQLKSERVAAQQTRTRASKAQPPTQARWSICSLLGSMSRSSWPLRDRRRAVASPIVHESLHGMREQRIEQSRQQDSTATPHARWTHARRKSEIATLRIELLCALRWVARRCAGGGV